MQLCECDVLTSTSFSESFSPKPLSSGHTARFILKIHCQNHIKNLYTSLQGGLWEKFEKVHEDLDALAVFAYIFRVSQVNIWHDSLQMRALERAL